MNDMKSLFASRTVWANVVGMLALAGAWMGIDIGTDDANRLTEGLLQLVTAGSLVASTVFRVLAQQRIAL